MQNNKKLFLKIQKEFQSFGNNLDQPIQEIELKNWLNNKVYNYKFKTGDLYDDDLFDQIVTRILTVYQNDLTINNFIEILIEAKDNLVEQIKATQQDIENKKEQKNQIILKLQNEQKIEKLNKFGIMEGSQLLIKIANVQANFEHKAIYIKLQLENQNQQTQLFDQYKSIDIQNFQFDVITGNESLNVYIITSEDEILGNVSADLFSLKDQQTHQENLEFESLNECSIDIALQWIWNKVQMYKDCISDIDQENQENQTIITDLQDDIQKLLAPFKSINFDLQQINEKNNMNQQNQSSYEKDTEYAFQYHSILYQHRYLKKDNLLQFRISLLLIFIIDLFVSFDKCIFINIMIISGIMALWEQDKLDYQHSTYSLYALIFSFINDIIWVCIWVHLFQINHHFSYYNLYAFYQSFLLQQSICLLAKYIHDEQNSNESTENQSNQKTYNQMLYIK